MERLFFEKIHRINYLFAEMDALYHQAALKLGMADSIMRVLYTIHDNGERCPLAEIYKRSGISKQTVNSAIRKLEEEEILYLEHYRGRTKMAILTRKGRDYVEQTVARLFAAEVGAFSSWAETEIDAHIRYLERYLDGFRIRLPDLATGAPGSDRPLPEHTADKDDKT